MIECPKCHARYEGPVAFCGGCGTKLSARVSVPAVAADPLVGMVIDGRYRVVDLIGRGGMGAVYRVEHVKMGKVMAMKLLHGELSRDADVVRRFKREAEAASRLTHMNTVSVFDFGSHREMMFLVMEYIDGRDLSLLLRETAPVPAVRTAKILVQVCSALKEAHSKGIIHRDLKPENIIVTDLEGGEDFVKVVDFGLAKLRDIGDRTKITAQGSLVGTPYYMAPETIRGENVSAASDVYALGAVMYKLVTGEVPFAASTPMGVITKHLTDDPAPPSKAFPRLAIPSEVDGIVARAMAKSPSDRYSSAEEMRRHLADLVAALDPTASGVRFTSADTGHQAETVVPRAAPKPPPPRKSRSSTVTIGVREVPIGTRNDVIDFESGMRRKRVAWIVALVALVVAGLGAGAYHFMLRPRGDASSPTLESEPNDSPGQADPLEPNVQLAAFVAGSDPRGDTDWYLLRGPGTGAWALDVRVTGVPALDLALQLVDPAADEPLSIANAAGQGQGEVLGPVVVEKPDVYLMIQEVRRPGIPPGSFDAQPYGVTFRRLDPRTVEREPNDGASSATPAAAGTPIAGRLEGPEDVDWYCLPAGASAGSVQVSGGAGANVALSIRSGQAPESTVDSLGAGQGEVARIAPGPGPVCAAVRQVAPEGVDAGAVPAAAAYQILFR